MTVQDWLGEENQLGIDIWNRKYRYRNESFDEWIDRVSGGDKELAGLIREKKFLFGGRTLSNRGTDRSASYSNCYSLGFVGDSLDELMQAATDIAKTFKSQGGQGLSLSKVRPKSTPIAHGQFRSDGIIPFMEIYNRVTESISQGGSRKGALLMSLDIWHREAESFIRIKSEEGRIQKANLSLEIDDAFMEDVRRYYETGETVTRTITRTYEGNTITYEVTPIRLYQLMMEKAWDWGEPGCLFVNQLRNRNMMEKVDSYRIETVNPCGEQPLPGGGACNLGSLNLSAFVHDPFTGHASFDFDGFRSAVTVSVRALDRIIDENQNHHALPIQKEMALRYRNIGLGVMGLYDMLAKLGMRYGSPESIAFSGKLMHEMFRTAVIASSRLAEMAGAFPGYEPEVLDSAIIREHFTDAELEQLGIRKNGLRNCSLLSIAPAGSIGTMLNVATGAEPAFSISYTRKTESLNGEEDKSYTVFTGVAKEYLDLTGEKELPSYFVTAGDIPWKERIDMQSELQKHVDTGISSTVNLPHEVTVSDIELLYLYAWEKKLKGVTIFRDRCRRAGILSRPAEPEKPKPAPDAPAPDGKQPIPRGVILKADDRCIGLKRTITSGCGTLHVEAFFTPDTGDLYETYFSKGSTGGCNSFMVGLSRMISLAARGGVPFEAIVDQLHSTIVCASYAVRAATRQDTSKGSCCPVAIGYVLEDMHREVLEVLGLSKKAGTAVRNPGVLRKETSRGGAGGTGLTCPVCGGTQLVFTGGCVECKACGWSQCG